MEGVESGLLVGVESPGLATIEQRAQHAGQVYLHLVTDSQHGVVPDPLCSVQCLGRGCWR